MGNIVHSLRGYMSLSCTGNNVVIAVVLAGRVEAQQEQWQVARHKCCDMLKRHEIHVGSKADMSQAYCCHTNPATMP